MTGSHLIWHAVGLQSLIPLNYLEKVTEAKRGAVNFTRMLDDNEMLTSCRWCCCRCSVLLFMTLWPSPLFLSPSLSGQYDVMSPSFPPSHETITNQRSAVPPLNLLTPEPSLNLPTCHLAIIWPVTPTTDTLSECACVCVCGDFT